MGRRAIGYFICDRCGLRYKRDKLRKDWNGAVVDPGCLDGKHPQDFPQHRDFGDPTPYRDIRQEPDDPFA